MAGVPVTPGAGTFQAMPGPLSILETSNSASGREKLLSLPPPNEVQLSAGLPATGTGGGGSISSDVSGPEPLAPALGRAATSPGRPAPVPAPAPGVLDPAFVAGRGDGEPERVGAAPVVPPAPKG